MDNHSIDAAYAHCRRIAQGHYENFPVGSLLIPRRLRKHFFALYAFMRIADDFADLPHRSSEERIATLLEWRELLHATYRNEDLGNPIFLALQATIRTFHLPIEPFDLLLDAFTFDAMGSVHFVRYDDLHWYTVRSAEPVGQLVLALFGHRDAESIRMSNDICTALQLLNFLQDAKEDLAANRCYFPLEDCALFGIERPEQIPNSASRNALILFECNRIETLLAQGAPLPDFVGGRLKLELRAVLAGATLMLGKIRTVQGSVFDERPKLSTFEKSHILLSGILN